MDPLEEEHTQEIKIDQLDLEFKEILSIIRKQIPYISDNHFLNQYGLWLEKLSEIDEDKIQRNLYLYELANQIQTKKLSFPFNQPPPVGGLKSFHGSFRLPKLQKILEENETTQYLPIQNTIDFIHSEDLIQALTAENEDFGMESYKINDIPTKEEETLQDNDCNTSLDKNRTKEPYLMIHKTDEKESNSILSDKNTDFEVSLDDNNSWVDLSESSSSEYVEKDKTYKILQNFIQSGKILSKPESLEIMFPKNKSLKDTNYISEDWKNTIEALQVRLSEMTNENKELKITIKRMEVKMDDDAKKHEIDLSRKLKLADDHWLKEINKIKEASAQNIFDLEKTFTFKLEENNLNHEHRYDKLLEDCEKIIVDAKSERDCVIQQKNDEINRLTEIIQKQCVRIIEEISNLQNQISNCNCEGKIHILRKCIGKMEKLFHRSEKEHLRQIEKLRQELEIKESALQIQLKTQKAELLTKTSCERQEEFEGIVNTLEVKYIQMLEMHEIQVMQMKRRSEEKIEHLVELLIKNDVSLNQIGF